ncbi:MAG: hypothetical protein V7637_3866 [Mycobacteriales bacterium]
MRLWRQRRSPEDCALLWEVVGSAGGRDDDEAVRRVVRAAEAPDAADLGELYGQYCLAMVALDTAEHARWITGLPWRGPGQPFSASRFTTARESAILLGREFYLGVLSAPSRMAFAVSPRTVDLGSELQKRLPPQKMIKMLRQTAATVPMENVPGWPDIPDGYDPLRYDPDNRPLLIFLDSDLPADVSEEWLDDAADRAEDLVWDLLGRPITLTEDSWSSVSVELTADAQWQVEELEVQELRPRRGPSVTVSASAPMAGLETWTDDRLRDVTAAMAARALLSVDGIRLRGAERDVLTRLAATAGPE